MDSTKLRQEAIGALDRLQELASQAADDGYQVFEDEQILRSLIDAPAPCTDTGDLGEQNAKLRAMVRDFMGDCEFRGSVQGSMGTLRKNYEKAQALMEEYPDTEQENIS